jgi:hypothetical protein
MKQHTQRKKQQLGRSTWQQRPNTATSCSSKGRVPEQQQGSKGMQTHRTPAAAAAARENQGAAAHSKPLLRHSAVNVLGWIPPRTTSRSSSGSSSSSTRDIASKTTTTSRGMRQQTYTMRQQQMRKAWGRGRRCRSSTSISGQRRRQRQFTQTRRWVCLGEGGREAWARLGCGWQLAITLLATHSRQGRHHPPTGHTLAQRHQRAATAPVLSHWYSTQAGGCPGVHCDTCQGSPAVLSWFDQ